MKLSDDKKIGGSKTRLTNKWIDDFQKFYGQAIRSNSRNKKDMKNAIWAIFYHCISCKGEESEKQHPTQRKKKSEKESEDVTYFPGAFGLSATPDLDLGGEPAKSKPKRKSTNPAEAPLLKKKKSTISASKSKPNPPKESQTGKNPSNSTSSTKTLSKLANSTKSVKSGKQPATSSKQAKPRPQTKNTKTTKTLVKQSHSEKDVDMRVSSSISKTSLTETETNAPNEFLPLSSSTDILPEPTKSESPDPEVKI
ncbi:triadin-like [Clytia hemisphaerica]|uniref:triadin-like n=1 Tax=Clytia hemisphaerica TaxID=252671 RepID=UPI0034D4A370